MQYSFPFLKRLDKDDYSILFHHPIAWTTSKESANANYHYKTIEIIRTKMKGIISNLFFYCCAGASQNKNYWWKEEVSSILTAWAIHSAAYIHTTCTNRLYRMRTYTMRLFISVSTRCARSFSVSIYGTRQKIRMVLFHKRSDIPFPFKSCNSYLRQLCWVIWFWEK